MSYIRHLLELKIRPRFGTVRLKYVHDLGWLLLCSKNETKLEGLDMDKDRSLLPQSVNQISKRPKKVFDIGLMSQGLTKGAML